jgi:hypothetical protein
MTSTSLRLALVLLACAAPLAPGHAESLASSASSAGSVASGSLSESVHSSSRSSGGKQNVADGDYRVIEIAQLPGRTGFWRLRLQADAPAGNAAPDEFSLDLPQQALGKRGLATGDIVHVRQQSYGLQFARTPTRETFFLALNDAWRHGLAAHPVHP